jgi:hypothetical protein
VNSEPPRKIQTGEATKFLLHAGLPVKEHLTMIRPISTFRVVLLVALALCVGGPPSLFALERTPEIAVATNDQPDQIPPQAQLVTDNGDPDDWASRTEEDEMSIGGVQTLLDAPGSAGVTWRDYVEYLSGRLISIKLYLTGIL